MTREQGFERRLAEWIDDGPLEAPRQPIAAAIAFASDHPRRAPIWSGTFKGLAWRRRRWAIALSAGAVGTLLIAGLVFGPALLNPGPGSSSRSPSASAPAMSTPARPFAPITGPVHVSSKLGSTDGGYGFGNRCGSYCDFSADILATNDRLSGCYILQPTGYTGDGVWGNAAFYDAPCPYSTARPGSEMTWAGEWFTAGWRPAITFGTDLGDSAVRALYPVDRAWLHGLGENTGLTAVLTIQDAGQIDGWIFPTPEPVAIPARSGSSPSASGRPAESSAPIVSPVHVTSTYSGASWGGASSADLGPWFFAQPLATNDRLSGCSVLQPATTLNWGSASFYDAGCSWGTLPSGQLITWEGEWFASSPDTHDAIPYPVDSVWLHGRGGNEGLSAILTMPAAGEIDGWIFPTPPTPN